MAAAIGAITIGGLLIASALKGVGITDILSGALGTLNPAGGKKTFPGLGDVLDNAAGMSGGTPGTGGGPTIAEASGSPRAIIEGVAIPIANRNGIQISPASVAAANGRHGPTITGSVSDHQGPGERAWAMDAAGTRAQMDATARDLANKFGMKWAGSGVATVTRNGMRYQMIYRSMVGGNHFGHVHFGARRVG